MRGNSLTQNYVTRTFVQEPAWLSAPRAKGEELVPGMQISSYEGHLLSWLVKVSGAKRILEIGTFMGTSTLWMASALPEGGHITSIEFKKEHADLARAHVAASPHAAKIEIVQSAGLDWLRQQKPGPQFDLMFFDAVKSEYPKYLEEGLKLLTPRGWIVGDNTLLFGALSGEVPDGASDEAKAGMQAFNERLAKEFDAVLLPTQEGMTAARRRA